MKKHEALFEREGIRTISFLFNNAHEVGDYIIAGTRGWFHDDDCRNMPESADFEKLTRREAMRLKTSLDAAVHLKGESEKEIIAFMHFPPCWSGAEAESIMDLLSEYGVKRAYYGHIHGAVVPETATCRGIELHLISADHLGFVPKIVK